MQEPPEPRHSSSQNSLSRLICFNHQATRTQTNNWQTNTARHNTYSPQKPVNARPESQSWQSHINHSVLSLAHSYTSAKSLLAGRSQPVTPSPNNERTRGALQTMMLLSSLRPNEKQINSAQSNNTLPTPKHTRFLPLLIQLGDVLKLKNENDENKQTSLRGFDSCKCFK